VYLLTLSPKGPDKKDKISEVKLNLAKQGITLINFNYTPFGFRMLFKLIYILFYLIVFSWRNKIKTIHAWCTPAGAIGYVLSLVTGRPLVLDSFEPHAQTMLETNTWKKNSLAYRILFFLEGHQLARATHVICAAEGMINYSKTTYGIKKDHYYVKPACVNLDLFNKKTKDNLLVPELKEKTVVCIYAGKFGDIYLSREVFDFFKIASDYWGDSFKVLLLTNHSEEELSDFCKQSNLKRETLVKRFVPHHEVPNYMALGDFGICPVNPVPSKEFCTPIKNGEYWAMGLPVVITKNISTDSQLIHQQNAGYVLNDLNAVEYQKAVLKIDDLLKDPNLHQRIRAIAEQYRNFQIAEDIYASIYA
jgi:glycosyltransferase involved in cell wall biosynthesis